MQRIGNTNFRLKVVEISLFTIQANWCFAKRIWNRNLDLKWRISLRFDSSADCQHELDNHCRQRIKRLRAEKHYVPLAVITTVG